MMPYYEHGGITLYHARVRPDGPGKGTRAVATEICALLQRVAA